MHLNAVAIAWVIGSAFLHALWNAMIKRDPDPRRATFAVLAISAISAGALVPLTVRGTAFPTTPGFAWAIAAGLFEAGYFVALAGALSRAPLGVAYTLSRGGAMFLVWPVSFLALGERVSSGSVLGVTLLCAGLLAVGFEGWTRATPAGVVWSLTAAACIGGYHLCYKQSLAEHAAPAGILGISLLVALPLNLLRLGRAQSVALGRVVAARPLSLIGAGLICTASFVLFLGALGQTGAGAALSLRNTSVGFAQLMGLVMGERPSPRQWFGVAFVGLGAYLISAAHGS